jgi:hypothetical protein
MNVRGNAVAIVDGQLQAHLGGNLRAVYQPVVEETLPERLRNLLDALDRREMKSRLPQEANLGRMTPEKVDPAAKKNIDRIKQ